MQIGYQGSKRKTQQGLTTWTLYHDCENKECQAGEVVTSEIGYLDFTEDANSSYVRFTERLAAESAAKTLQKSLKTVPSIQLIRATSLDKRFLDGVFHLKTCRENLVQETIEEQTESIANSPLFNPALTGRIDYIHLETGWQPNPGKLSLKRENFPDGMAPVVEQIHAKGFKASICIDPFCIERKSELLQKYPKACLRYNNKNKLNQKMKNQFPVNLENLSKFIYLGERVALLF